MSQEPRNPLDALQVSSLLNPELNMSQLVYPEDEREEGILDLRQISIVNSLPIWKSKKEVLVVGSGDCKLDNYLVSEGYTVYSTDMPDGPGHGDTGREKYAGNINYTNANIFDLESFPVKKAETVICSEVLEHIPDWSTAALNLLELTKKRLIITVPHHRSYDVVCEGPAGHCNYWTDLGDDCFDSLAGREDVDFESILCFTQLFFPYQVSISKVVTKPEDWFTSSRDYLIIVDKLQLSNHLPSFQDGDCGWWIECMDGDDYQVHKSPRLNRETQGWAPTKIGPPLPYHRSQVSVIIHNFDVWYEKQAGENIGRVFINEMERELNLYNTMVQPISVTVVNESEINNGNFTFGLQQAPGIKGNLKSAIFVGSNLLSNDAVRSLGDNILKVCCCLNSEDLEKLGDNASLYDHVFNLENVSWGEIGKYF